MTRISSLKHILKPDYCKNVVADYNAACSEANDSVMELNRGLTLGVELIEDAVDLINSIAHSSKSIDSGGDAGFVLEYATNSDSESGKVGSIPGQTRRNAQTSIAIAGAGTASGLAVNHLAPRAAMWAARTFGTASTGVAISSLSGAAMESASLACIGGGALSAGGGGMAAGSAVLGLAGPIGWIIVAGTAAVSLGRFTKKQLELQKDIDECRQYTNHMRREKFEIDNLTARINPLLQALTKTCEQCDPLRGAAFTDLDDSPRRRLTILVHQTSSLALLLHLNARERELAARLFEENRALDAQLESEWRQHLDRLKADMEVFLSLVVEMASVDAAAACEASVALARRLGIPSEDILDTPEKARAYFMD